MILPFSLPPWLPWWVPIVVLVPALLYVLVFLLVPFSVFGIKGRLDVIDARLDELHGEIRELVLRLPALPDEQGYDMPNLRRVAAGRPPIPPAVARPTLSQSARDTPDDEGEPPRGGTRGADRPPRTPAAEEPPRRRPPPPAPPPREEPRLDWPR